MNWLLAFGAFMLGGTLGATLMAIMASAKHPKEPFDKHADRTLKQ